MNDSRNHVNKVSGKTRISSSSIDENLHSNSNGTSLSLQTFVDDIPFEFNPKYRTIHVPNVHLADYDTQTIQNLLSTTIDFALENRVLEEAIEDVKRKKKEIEADGLTEPSSKSSKTSKTNCPASDSSSVSPVRLPESVPLPIVLPTIAHPTPSSSASSSSAVGSFPSIHPPTHATFSSPSNSYRLPSVRDIYWPTSNQQQYAIPPSHRYPLPVLPAASVSIPTPLRAPPPQHSIPFHPPPAMAKPMTTTTTITPSSSSVLLATPASTATKNSINTNELAVTFDQTLTSDDPFHDAELKSLNDVVELNHLYSAFGSANTVRR